MMHRKRHQSLHEAQQNHSDMFVNGHPNAAAHYLIAESLRDFVEQGVKAHISCGSADISIKYKCSEGARWEHGQG
jgi:hypothetical protein